jgi:hypothetical protein
MGESLRTLRCRASFIILAVGITRTFGRWTGRYIWGAEWLSGANALAGRGVFQDVHLPPPFMLLFAQAILTLSVVAWRPDWHERPRARLPRRLPSVSSPRRTRDPPDCPRGRSAAADVVGGPEPRRPHRHHRTDADPLRRAAPHLEPSRLKLRGSSIFTQYCLGRELLDATAVSALRARQYLGALLPV